MSARIDAELFDPARISPEILEFNKIFVEGMSAAGWEFPAESAPALRDALARSMPEPYLSESARTITVPGPAGDIPVRIIPAEQPSAVYVHCHGGGFAIGAAAGQDAALERIVTATGMTVASVDYRLAPEHPYPAGLDDCERVVRWLLDHAAAGGPGQSNAEAELGSGRLLIGGESAGANLALCTALRVVRDQPDALSGIALY
jgi:acetyl esterase/lipase